MRPILVISGPTASGKSALAVELAKSLGGEVLNIDSVQVYRGLDIGTAKMLPDEQQGIPHHLIDTHDPTDAFDAATFLDEAHGAIADMQSRDRLCLAAGGTTLYITLLFHGLAALPGGSKEVRQRLRALTLQEQYERLEAVDAETARRIHPNDRIRIERALETFELTGEKASRLHAQHAFQPSAFRGLLLVLCLPRDELYRRIDARSFEMFDRGLVAETRAVLARYGTGLGPLSSIGYAQAVKVIEGQYTLEQAIEEVQRETRNLAKRQSTFWRNEPRKRGWVSHPRDEEEGIELKSDPSFYAHHKRVADFRVCDFTFSELLTRVTSRLREEFSRNEVWYINAGRALDTIGSARK